MALEGLGDGRPAELGQQETELSRSLEPPEGVRVSVPGMAAVVKYPADIHGILIGKKGGGAL